MQCTRQTRSGIGGDRGADRGILAARMQGAERAGERREHASRRNESARGPCTCAVEVDWGADPMRGSGGCLIILITTPSYHHAVTLLPCCHEHHRPAPEFAIDSLLEEAGFELVVPPSE